MTSTKTLKIYPSQLPGEPIETHQLTGTVGEWLSAKYPDTYEPAKGLQLKIDGRVIPAEEWATAPLGNENELRFSAQKAVVNILAPAIQFFVDFFTPEIPSNRQAANGEKIATADVKGNTPKLGDAIPEQAGRFQRFPDYLLPMHRYFEDKRIQRLNILLCVGEGKFDIPVGNVKIGNTPLISLPDVADFTIYQPGADLSAEPAAEWWHSTKEVGGSSLGTAGLELTATFELDPIPTADAYIFDEFDITIPSGAGEFPDGWVDGLTVRIENPKNFTVTDGVTRSIISLPLGEDFTELEPFDGMVIEIAGDNEGLYVIHEYLAYSAGSSGTDGSASILTASAEPLRYDFSIMTASFNITLGADTYPINLTTNTVDLFGLVSEIDSQLPANLTAYDTAGRVRIAEISPFSGDTLGATGSFSDVLGASPTATAGTETVPASGEQQAQITLNYDDASPVSALTTGTRSMSIGYRGLLYETTAGSLSTISVDRLNDTGTVDVGWAGFDFAETVLATLELDGSSLEGDWTGPFYACPEGKLTQNLEWDLFFPEGLIFIKKNGNSAVAGVDIEFQYRDADIGGAWSSITEKIIDETKDQLGFTRELTLAYPQRPEVRMRRINAASTRLTVADKVQWYGLRAKLPIKSSYDGVTVLALTLQSGDKLAAQSERDINVEGTRILPYRVGGEWMPEAPTRSIGAFVAYIAQSIGYTDDQIDLLELDRLEAIWAERGDTYDWVHDESTVREAINQALQAGFAEMTVDRGRIRPVRDEIRTVFEENYKPQLYSPQNMTKPLTRSFEAIKQDDADGVDVTYIDERTWNRETVEVRLPSDAGFKVQKITIDGVTDRDRAWRIGMRRRRMMRYQRWSYDWGTELDGLVSRYLSYCSVATDVPGYGKSCLVEYAEVVSGGVLLQVSEPLTFTGSDVVGIRLEDGTLDGPYVAIAGETDYEVIAQGMISAPPILDDREPPHAVIGTTERWAFPVLVKRIAPQGYDSVSLSAVNYAPEVYADDDNNAPV